MFCLIHSSWSGSSRGGKSILLAVSTARSSSSVRAVIAATPLPFGLHPGSGERGGEGWGGGGKVRELEGERENTHAHKHAQTNTRTHVHMQTCPQTCTQKIHTHTNTCKHLCLPAVQALRSRVAAAGAAAVAGAAAAGDAAGAVRHKTFLCAVDVYPRAGAASRAAGAAAGGAVGHTRRVASGTCDGV